MNRVVERAVEQAARASADEDGAEDVGIGAAGCPARTEVVVGAKPRWRAFSEGLHGLPAYRGMKQDHVLLMWSFTFQSIDTRPLTSHSAQSGRPFRLAVFAAASQS